MLKKNYQIIAISKNFDIDIEKQHNDIKTFFIVDDIEHISNSHFIYDKVTHFRKYKSKKVLYHIFNVFSEAHLISNLCIQVRKNVSNILLISFFVDKQKKLLTGVI